VEQLDVTEAGSVWSAGGYRHSWSYNL